MNCAACNQRPRECPGCGQLQCALPYAFGQVTVCATTRCMCAAQRAVRALLLGELTEPNGGVSLAVDLILGAPTTPVVITLAEVGDVIVARLAPGFPANGGRRG